MRFQAGYIMSIYQRTLLKVFGIAAVLLQLADVRQDCVDGVHVVWT